MRIHEGFPQCLPYLIFSSEYLTKFLQKNINSQKFTPPNHNSKVSQPCIVSCKKTNSKLQYVLQYRNFQKNKKKQHPISNLFYATTNFFTASEHYGTLLNTLHPSTPINAFHLFIICRYVTFFFILFIYILLSSIDIEFFFFFQNLFLFKRKDE